MPNLVTNVVELSIYPIDSNSDTEKQIKTLKDLVKRLKGSNNGFDFNAVSPMPPDSSSFKATGTLSNEDLQKFGKENTWYVWATKHWGTKWNAKDVRWFEGELPNRVRVQFITAWEPPRPVFEKIASQVALRYRYLDEGLEEWSQWQELPVSKVV